MSVPDCELEEPSDLEWCFVHASYRPCSACRSDEADRQYDERRDRGYAL